MPAWFLSARRFVNAQTDALPPPPTDSTSWVRLWSAGHHALRHRGWHSHHRVPGQHLGHGAQQVQTLSPLTIDHALNQASLNVNATAVNQVVPSPESNLAFITYSGSTGGASLPYYVPGTCVPALATNPLLAQLAR